MNKAILSRERKQYLKDKKRKQRIIFLTQIGILVTFLAIWEILANQKIIDSFITSQPSRIRDTFMNLGSNELVKHIKKLKSKKSFKRFIKNKFNPTRIKYYLSIIYYFGD